MTTNRRSRMSVASRGNFCTPSATSENTGIISRPTMKAFDRTSVVNSQIATISALFFIGRLDRPSSVDSGDSDSLLRRPRDAHEDVVQRRAPDLEVVDRRPRGEIAQELLRIG